MKSNTSYKTIRFKEAKYNPEYWQVVQYMFHEQAARIIQGKWRSFKKITFKGKYSETLNGLLCLHFIKEPYGTKASEHAKRIKDGQWLDLDYKDPEFTRNIFKALRLKKVTLNEMVTVKYLFDAQIQFKVTNTHEIKQFRFDRKGPYTLNSVLYATETHKRDFFKNLQLIPQKERCYFSIDFKREDAINFIAYMLQNSEDNGLFIHSASRFCKILTVYLSTLVHDINFLSQETITVEELFKAIELVTQIEKTKLKSDIQELKALIVKWEKKYNLTDSKNLISEKLKSVMSPRFLAILFRVGEQVPFIEISPNFNLSNPDSPIISFILPTTSALILLQETFHGKETTYPYFTVGQLSPRLIRMADETPKVLNLKNHSRPIELTHPDLKATQNPHGIASNDFGLSWHDFPFHTTRNSSIDKSITRYLRNLFSIEKGYDMSKTIWFLTDLDLWHGANMKIAIKANDKEKYHHEFGKMIIYILKKCGNVFSKNPDDNGLLILIDMVINKDDWKEMLGKFPKDFFNEEIFTDKLETKIQAVLNKIENIIAFNPNRCPFKSKIYYILAYRLKDVSKGLELCKTLDEKIGLDTLFSWNRNAGLKFQPNFSNLSKEKLENIQPEDLFNDLLSAIEQSGQQKRISLQRANYIKKLFDTRLNPRDLFGIFMVSSVAYVGSKLVSGLVRSLK